MSSRRCRRRLRKRLIRLLVAMRKVRMARLRRVQLKLEHLRPQPQEFSF
jgi:hypothetical protein